MEPKDLIHLFPDSFLPGTLAGRNPSDYSGGFFLFSESPGLLSG